jgi:hypothetical protein
MKFKNITKLCAVAGVCASLNTGCVSTGNSQQAYMGYITPDADKAAFEAKKEAYQNQGYVVEAVFMPDGKVAYGVREKTFLEKTNGTLQKYGATIDTVYKAGDLANGVMNNVGTWRVGSKINSAGRRVSTATGKQTAVIENGFDLINNTLKTKLSSCNE